MPSRVPHRFFGRVDLDTEDQPAMVKRSVLSTASVGLQGILRFLYSVLIGRWLGPAVLATTNGAIAVAQIASLAYPIASGNAAVKFIARARGRGDLELAWSSAAYLSRGALIAAALVAAPTGVIVYTIVASHSIPLAVTGGLLAFTLSAYSFVRGVYFSAGLVSRVAGWDVITLVVGLGLLLVFLALGWTELVLLPLALGYGLYAIAGWPRRPKGRGRTPLPHALRHEMNAFILWGSLSALATSGFIQLTMVIANWVGTGDEAGWYAAALSIATPASLLSSVLSLVLFPTMAHASGRDDDGSMVRQADLSTRGLVFALGAVFGVLAILAEPLLSIVYGPGFTEGATDLRILLAASLAVTLSAGTVTLLQAGGRSSVRLASLLSAGGVALGLIAMTALVPFASTTGVALGYLVGALVSGFGPILVVWRRYGMPWFWLWIRFAAGVACAALIIVAAEAFDWPLLGILVASVAYVAVWAALMTPEIRMLTSMRN
jgi:putative peptidoglycan lipid II flippase